MRINAVFEGGGVKGIALVGAIKRAEELSYQFHQTAGTSSGAIVAALLTAGYTADEMKQLILSTPFRMFAKPTDWMRLKWIGPPIRLLIYKGLYAADPLERWVHGLLKNKGIETFGDLPAKRLRIIASDISGGKLMTLPDDLPYYGIDPAGFSVARAVRMSASIPYFFEPAIIKNKQQESVYVVDGALLSNFPLWLFDKEHEFAGSGSSGKLPMPTIGFQLVGRNTQSPMPINGPFSMFYALFVTMMEAHDERYIEDQNRFRTIKIPTLGVRTTQFDLSDELSMRLYESGYEAGSKFFAKWSLVSYQKSYELFNGKCPPKKKL